MISPPPLSEGPLHSSAGTPFLGQDHAAQGAHPPPPQGRFTLLLGPPSSGKTTLLKVLAGNVTNGEDGLRIKGSITYNGEGFDKFQASGGVRWPLRGAGPRAPE